MTGKNYKSVLIAAMAIGYLAMFDLSVAFAQDAMFVDSTGNVGIGTNTPQRTIHIFRSDGSAELRVQEASGSFDTRTLFELRNNGSVRFDFTDSSTGRSWDFSLRDNGFNINNKNVLGQELLVRDNGEFAVGPGGTKNFVVHPNGDATLAGTLSQNSSVTTKSKIVSVDAETLLAKLSGLNISEWNYTGDPDTRHVGPMAEQFYEVYGLGKDPRHIAASDLASVALSAAKALQEQNRELRAELSELRARVDALSN